MPHTLLLFAILLLGCKSPELTSSSDTTTIDQLIYKFHDSSVPPQYHRSYVITITSETIKKRVHSYGETISEDEHECTPEEFNAVLAAFKKAKIKNCKLPEDRGCSGGTGVSVITSKAGEAVFQGYRSDCGGSNSGTMCGDTGEVLQALNKILRK